VRCWRGTTRLGDSVWRGQNAPSPHFSVIILASGDPEEDKPTVSTELTDFFTTVCERVYLKGCQARCFVSKKLHSHFRIRRPLADSPPWCIVVKTNGYIENLNEIAKLKKV
jgi:hypothetical protein